MSEGFLLNPEQAKAHLDLASIFGNGLPVELEIGSGKGTFILRRAAERPEINLLGVEWVGKYACYAADRARRAGLSNIRMICADAESLFKTALADKSLWRVHIYFPDPWPKARHIRRRLIKPDFLRQVRRTLKIGGWLGIVTDHEGYFRQIRSALSVVSGVAPVEFRRDSSDGSVVGTNFEKKYLAQGKPFYAVGALRYK